MLICGDLRLICGFQADRAATTRSSHLISVAIVLTSTFRTPTKFISQWLKYTTLNCSFTTVSNTFKRHLDLYLKNREYL